MDYNNTLFKIGYGVDGVSKYGGAPDTVYGKITYILDDEGSVNLPTSVPTPDNAPYTGRGFTGSKNIVLPEIYQNDVGFKTGDLLGIFDSKTGDIVTQFCYDKKLGEWILLE